MEENNDVPQARAIVVLRIGDAVIGGTEQSVAVAERDGDGNREAVGLYEDFFRVVDVEEEDVGDGMGFVIEDT